ncbi:MAG TPA: type II secretion system F family protein [Candidatus Dormibacteraeota bacterium]|nr:type II secretion system F family protein [Candidatus Dormibacteraeota bacterium]
MHLLIPLLGGLSAFFFAISLIPTKSPLSQCLEALRTAGAEAPSETVGSRALELVFNEERRGRLARQLIEAGWYTVTPVQIIFRVVAGACLGALFAMLTPRLIELPFALAAFTGATIFAAGAYAPIYALHRAIDARKAAVQLALPDFLDMVAATVQAGLSVNAALSYAVEAVPGPVGSEIKEALSEMRLGRSRAESLKAAAQRLNQEDFSGTITALTQAERMGTNVAAVLTELAEETRNRRIMMLEERATKLPVQMTIPMAVFLLPALFVIIFGAVAANYLATR